MANCPNCNHPQPENAIFCEMCGAMVTTDETVATPLEPPLITALRGVGGSGVMLLLAILNTLSLVINLAQGLISFLGSFSSGVSVSFSFPLFEIIICICAWSIYATCKKPVGSLISTGGITALRVIKIIKIVLSVLCLLLIALLIVVLALASGERSDYYGAEVSGILVLCAVVFAVVFVVLFIDMIVSIMTVRFYGGVQETLRSGFPYCRAALPLGILTMIGGIISAVAAVFQAIFSELIMGLFSQYIYWLDDIITSTDLDIRLSNELAGAIPGQLSIISGAFINLIQAVVMILMAVMIFKYRKTVKNHIG